MQNDERLDQLESLLNGMDVPSFRKRKVAWLRRNLAVRNSDHNRFNEAMELINELYANGTR